MSKTFRKWNNFAIYGASLGDLTLMWCHNKLRLLNLVGRNDWLRWLWVYSCSYWRGVWRLHCFLIRRCARRSNLHFDYECIWKENEKFHTFWFLTWKFDEFPLTNFLSTNYLFLFTLFPNDKNSNNQNQYQESFNNQIVHAIVLMMTMKVERRVQQTAARSTIHIVFDQMIAWIKV